LTERAQVEKGERSGESPNRSLLLSPRSPFRKRSPAYDFIAGALVLIFLFHVVPCVWGIALSFFRYDGIGKADWVGVDNYRRLAADPTVAASLWITLKYAFGAVPLSLAAGLVIALALDERWFRGKTLARTLFFMPNVISLVAVAFVWEWLLNPKFGIVNTVLQQAGIAGPAWLSDPRSALGCIVLVQVWHGLGFTVIVYLAGLQGIPETYYEAARLDGASRLQQVRHVTLPLLMPTVMFLSIMGFIGAFQVFQSVFMMTGGGPADATRVIVFYLWQVAFERVELGYASAIAVVIFAAVLALTLVQWRFFREHVEVQ
jgi:multiple sugar transport system permease protein